MWRLFARTSSVEQELEPQNIEKRRVRPCPNGQVTVSEQILSLANPAHSGRSAQRTRVTSWQYQAYTHESTAPRKEMCHSGVLHRELAAQTSSIWLTRARVLHHEKRCATVASLSRKVSSELASETNLTVHLGSMFLGVHLDSTFVVTCE